MVDCGGHINIEKLTYSEIESVEGDAGNFKVRVLYPQPAVIPTPDIDEETNGLVERIAARYDGGAEVVVPILQDVSAELNWLPPEVLMRISAIKAVPLEHILRIATFYKAFSLTPRGKYTVTVCLGTACHVKGASRIVSRLERDLGISVGSTTGDMRFSLETVRCLGCCGLSPVVTVGEDLYGNLTPPEAATLTTKYAE
jgi:NADH-quinone oxidoreductase subunit E